MLKMEERGKRIIFEYVPMFLAFVGIIVCTIVFKQQIIKVLPVCFSLLIMLFNSRANRIGFLLGATNCVIYIIGYFYERLYGTVLSTAFSAVIQLASFFQWKRHSYKENSTKFRALRNAWRIVLGVGILAAWALTSFVLWKMNANQVVLDGLLLPFGFLLPVMQMFAIIEVLPLQIFSMTISLVMWIRIVADGNLANLTYLIIGIYNLYMVVRTAFRWIALYREQHQEEKNAEQGDGL